MNCRILVVEDIPAQKKLIERCLSSQGYAIFFAQTGEEALAKVQECKPDIILLDLYLPDLDGIRVCEILKKDKTTRRIPVIMVTARGSVTEIINGLKVGADDYVSKPYNHRELLARIEAVLRRVSPQGEEEQIVKKGGLTLLLKERKIRVNKQEVPEVTRKEFDLLALLVQKSPQILAAAYLLQAVWGSDASRCGNHTIETHIYTLRKKLGTDIGKKIVSIYGFGYRFEE